jgi:hypothetical protein
MPLGGKPYFCISMLRVRFSVRVNEEDSILDLCSSRLFNGTKSPFHFEGKLLRDWEKMILV